jgi:SAM-dependent methyltransferase
LSEHALAVRWDLLPYINGQGLDLGCGDARPHDWMIGVDIAAGSGPRGPNLISDARELKLFADKSQDFVFSSYLLNELDNRPAVLAEWWRVLKDDGYLILFLPISDVCTPKGIVDDMVPLRPWQFVKATENGEQFIHVYRKCDRPTDLVVPDPERICAVMKLGAHGDALWASSVLPHLKEQGFHVILYTQETGETVLRHDPHIDQLIKFESRVPMAELGELFAWMEAKYKNCRILIEAVEGTLLPSPQKIQYHFPAAMRHKLMNFNYLEMHHMVAKVPLEPRVKFYPNAEEMAWANELRTTMQPHVVVLVPNGSSVSKSWPYAGELAKRLLEREDVTVVMIGDERNCTFEDHPRLLKVGLTWDVRRAMTFAQLASVVVGQETGMLNAVSHEADVHKIVLLSHSSVENLTRDWPNTTSIRELPSCGLPGACHRLHYNWEYCSRDDATDAAKCQAMISPDAVLSRVLDYLPAPLQQAA